MLIKIESIRCPYVTGLMSGCLRNCRPDTPEYASGIEYIVKKGKRKEMQEKNSVNCLRNKWGGSGYFFLFSCIV